MKNPMIKKSVRYAAPSLSLPSRTPPDATVMDDSKTQERCVFLILMLSLVSPQKPCHIQYGFWLIVDSTFFDPWCFVTFLKLEIMLRNKKCMVCLYHEMLNEKLCAIGRRKVFLNPSMVIKAHSVFPIFIRRQLELKEEILTLAENVWLQRNRQACQHFLS